MVAIYVLVGSFKPSDKISVNWDDNNHSQYMGKLKIMLQTTNQCCNQCLSDILSLLAWD